MRLHRKAGRSVSFFLAFMLLLSIIPATVWAETGSSGECKFAALNGSDGNNVLETVEVVGGGGDYVARIKLNSTNVTNDMYVHAWIMDQRQYFSLVEALGNFSAIDYGGMAVNENGAQSITEEDVESVIKEWQSPSQYSTDIGKMTICEMDFNLTNYAVMADTGESSPYYIIAKGSTGVVGIESAKFMISKNGTPVVTPGDAEVSIVKPAADTATSASSIQIETTVTPSAATATGDVSKMAYQLAFNDGTATKYLDGGGSWTTTETWVEDAVSYTAAGGVQTWTAAAALSDDGDYTLKVKALDGAGWSSVDSVSFKKDATGPKVASIARANGAAELTSGAAVNFKVTYNEAATQAAIGDFTATAGGVTGTIASVTGDGAADTNGYYKDWIVSVNTSGAADGDVVIGPVASQAAVDAAGNKLTDTSVASSQKYVLDKTAPSVTDIKIGGTSISSGAVGVTGVAISGTIKVTLNDANLMKSGNIATAAMTLTSGAVGSARITSAKYETDGTVSIAYEGLATETSYQLTIPTGLLTDSLGNALASQVQSCVFKTTNGVPNTVTWNNSGVAGGVTKTYGDADFTEAATALSTVGGQVTYSSSNTSVAAVDADGKVTIKGAGSATITATSASGGADGSGTPYISATNTYTLTVSQKKLVTSGWTFEKGYDATTAAALSDMKGGTLNKVGSTVYVKTGVGSEEILIGSVTAAFNTANVEAGQTVSVTAIALADNTTTGALAANYIVVGTDGANGPAGINPLILNGTITKQTLTWKTTSTAAVALDKVYDTNRTAIVPTGGLTLSAVTYFDGIAGPDQAGLEMKLLAGPYANAFAGADTGSHLVTIPKSGIELYLGGALSENYILPDSGTAISAEIAKTDASFGTAYTAKKGSMSAGSAPFTLTVQTSPGGVAVSGLTVDLNGSNTLDAVNVLYEVPFGAVTTTGAIYTYYDTATATDKSITVTDSAAHLYLFSSPSALAPTGPSVDWIDVSGSGTTAAAVGSVYEVKSKETVNNLIVSTGGSEWKTWNDAFSYVNGLAANATVNLKLFLAGGATNLNTIASPAATSAVLTIQSSGSSGGNGGHGGGGGGGSVSTYTVTYDAGDHGKIDKKTETVSNGNSPKGVTVTADDGWKFVGWSLNGKKVVSLKDIKVTESMKLTAIYEKAEEETVSTSQGFNKDWTSAYISGYPDGSFRADMGTTRAEVASMIAKILKDDMGSRTYSSDYSDLSGHWAANSIGFLSELGVVSGYPNGTFQPDKEITRAEFVTIVMRVDGLVDGDKSFSDVAGSYWAKPYILAAAEKEYVDGYKDGTFRPENPITRAEAVTILNAVLNWSADESGSGKSFTDLTNTHWAYDQVMKAANGILK